MESKFKKPEAPFLLLAEDGKELFAQSKFLLVEMWKFHRNIL